MSHIAVIGAGSWGTALSIVLADNGHHVSLYARRQAQVDEINERHTNEDYLPGITLSEQIKASNDYAEVLKNCITVITVTPTASMRSVLQEMGPYFHSKHLFVHASKGLEPETYKRVSEIMEEEIAQNHRQAVVVLSGPSHAEEVCLRYPTTVVASSVDMKQAEMVQDLFINSNFRVYTSHDIVGVELGGALKNIIALGAGLSDGLGYGDNAKAALMTRGLTEIGRLGVILGANPLTFSGLTGLGDLIVTCTSKHSRNWRCGYSIGKGNSLEETLEAMGMVVEGVRTTKAAYHLAQLKNANMPITRQLYEVLFKGKEPRLAVDDLMHRGRTNEMDMND